MLLYLWKNASLLRGLKRRKKERKEISSKDLKVMFNTSVEVNRRNFWVRY